jgi:hypothetical protein
MTSLNLNLSPMSRNISLVTSDARIIIDKLRAMERNSGRALRKAGRSSLIARDVNLEGQHFDKIEFIMHPLDTPVGTAMSNGVPSSKDGKVFPGLWEDGHVFGGLFTGDGQTSSRSAFLHVFVYPDSSIEMDNHEDSIVFSRSRSVIAAVAAIYFYGSELSIDWGESGFRVSDAELVMAREVVEVLRRRRHKRKYNYTPPKVRSLNASAAFKLGLGLLMEVAAYSGDSKESEVIFANIEGWLPDSDSDKEPFLDEVARGILSLAALLAMFTPMGRVAKVIVAVVRSLGKAASTYIIVKESAAVMHKALTAKEGESTSSLQPSESINADKLHPGPGPDVRLQW